LGLCRAALGRVVKFLTMSTEEFGPVHTGGMTVFGIVDYNKFEVTEAELLTTSPQKTITAWGQYRFQ